MREEPLDILLIRGRRRLNRIVIADQMAVTVGWVGGITGAVFLIARFLGWSGPTWLVWAVLTLASSLLGFIGAWRRRLDLKKTAQWLDDYFKERQTLIAALECLEREEAGRFDSAVIQRARDIAAEDRVIRWPVQGLIKRTGMAMGILIAISLLFMVGFPGISGRGYRATGGDQAGSSGQDPRETAGVRSGMAVQSPQTAARVLFPEDPKLAAVAERAIREGNTALLEQLLKEAQLEMERDLNLPGNSVPTEQERLREERQKRQSMVHSLMAQTSAGRAQGQNPAQSDRNPQGADGTRSDDGFTRNNPENPTSGQTNPRTGENPASGRYQPGQPFNSGLAGGPQQPTPGEAGPGSGLSGKGGPGRQPGAEMDWGKVAARNGPQQLIISHPKQGGMLELVLPGKNVTVPLSEAIPDWRRAAEAALAREGVPGEYQDFVRSYFLELSQETMGNGPESGDQK